MHQLTLTFAANFAVLMNEWTFTLNNISEIAADFWQQYKRQKVFAFNGEMGAGKTTFIHALCNEKNVSSTVSSPTFSIINEYSYADGSILHIDLYRLKDEEEAIRAGVEDALYSGNICLVEWPERIAALFPDGTINIYIAVVNEQTRRMRVEDK